jgi:hypothetical protein
MASIIRIKRSSVSGNPGTLGAGELAYSNLTDNGSNGGDRLYIGMGTESNGNAANHVVIGGKFFTDRLDHVAGTLTANSAIVVDADSKIDNLLVDNLQLNGNTISSTNTDGNIVLAPNGDGYVTISGTNALVIPKGTTAQQAPQVSGAIRFNTTNTSFEGYDGTNWSSLGGVRSVDQLTYVTAANNGNIDFYSDEVNVVTVDGSGIKIKTTTEATGSNTGALQVAGGVSIEGALYVQGNLSTAGGLSSDGYLALEGNPNYGSTGYGFIDDNDTGMFSEGDGYVQFWSNNTLAASILPNAGSLVLNADMPLQFGNYIQIGRYNDNTFFITPDTDNNNSSLRISDWDNSNRLNIWNTGNQGITLGNYDNGDSLIDIGGASGSWYDSPDDIAVWAKRNGNLFLRTNNGDIVQQNDSGSVTFRNSDGHLVIPGTIETNDTTGDVILAASNGTEKNAVFKGDGYFSLPDSGIQFYDSNNISGTKIAEMGFDGEWYINNFNNQISLYANDNARWQFTNTNSGTLVLPHGAILSDGSSNSILLGNGVDPSGYSQRISIGYQPDTQDGQSWDTIAIGARAGTTNQGNNAIAMGNRAGNSGQGSDAIAIGSSPNSSVGGAGYLNQGSYAVAIGAQAGETSQSSSAIAVGYLAGQTSQGYNAVAIGVNAGQVNQQQNAVAIGNNAGHTGQSLTSIAIGEDAADTDQGFSAIALGRWAGSQYQGQKAIAIGRLAGRYNQGGWAVAIGHHAGMGVFDTSSQGTNAIAIGAHAGEYSQHANSIVIQATANGNGTGINPSEQGLYIDPIRNVNDGTQYVIYNSDTKEVTYNATNLKIDANSITATNTDGDIELTPNGAGTINASSSRITNVATPINGTDAANRSYVDSKVTGLTWKDSVHLLSNTNIPLTGSGSTLSIDSHATLTASNNGYRILLINQTDPAENGIYVYEQGGGTYTLTRSADTDTYQELVGMAVYVMEGTVYGATGWTQTNTYLTNFGETGNYQTYVQFAGSGAYTAGDGLSLTGVTFAVNVAASGGIEIVDDELQLKSSLAGDGLTYSSGVLSIGGSADRISVSTDSIDIASTYVGQTSITTLGTVTSGTWNATAIGSAYGGTGFTSYAKGDLIYASATNTLSKLNGGDSGKILQMSDTGVPTWGDIDGGTY